MPIRVIMIALAGVLSFASAWLVAAESLRPGLGYFPTNTADARSLAAAASPAGMAASIGWPRGELASENAVAAYADELVRPDGGTGGVTALKETSLSAIQLAPYDARPWLILAAQEIDSDRRQKILRMTYYTVPASAQLFPTRARLTAVQQPVDDELRTLLEFEIGILLKQDDGFEADLAKIYLAAPDSERGLLERLLNAAAPSVLAKLKNRTR